MNRKTKGAAFLVLSSFSFALMSAFVSLAGELPFYQKVLFRNLVAVIVVGGVLLVTRSPLRVPKPSRLPVALRSVFGLVGVFCNYYAIDHLPLASSNSLNKLAPFFAILFAALFLRERVERVQLGCVALALAGSMFLIVPSLETVGFASLVALTGGVVSGGAHVSLRVAQSRSDVSSSSIVFVFSLFSTVVAAIPCLAHWTPMAPRQVMFMLLAGSACASAQYSLTLAYRFAAPKDISIYDSTQIIFSAVLGFLIFGQIPTFTSFIAYVLIILASTLLFFYNRREKPAK